MAEGKVAEGKVAEEKVAEEKVVVYYWNPIRPPPALRGSGWPPRKSSSTRS